MIENSNTLHPLITSIEPLYCLSTFVDPWHKTYSSLSPPSLSLPLLFVFSVTCRGMTRKKNFDRKGNFLYVVFWSCTVLSRWYQGGGTTKEILSCFCYPRDVKMACYFFFLMHPYLTTDTPDRGDVNEKDELAVLFVKSRSCRSCLDQLFFPPCVPATPLIC